MYAQSRKWDALLLYEFFNAWEWSSAETKYDTLSIAKGRGAKVKLLNVKEALKDMLKEYNRNLNAIIHLLKEEHQIQVCKSPCKTF